MRLIKLALSTLIVFLMTSSCTIPSVVTDLIKQQATHIVLPQSKVTPQMIYFDNIPTEVITSGDLGVVRSATIEHLQGKTTYVLLENKNSDPSAVVEHLQYKLTWLDDQNRAVVEGSGDYRGMILPGEKMLVNISMDPTGDNKNRKIKLARLEITAVGMAQIAETDRNKIRALKLTHPLITVSADPFELEQKDFFDNKYMVAAVRLVIRNNLDTKIATDVVGLFLNMSGQVVGVGLTSNLGLQPRGTSIVVLTTSAMSGPASSSEYYASVYSHSTWSEVYREAFK